MKLFKVELRHNYIELTDTLFILAKDRSRCTEIVNEISVIKLNEAQILFIKEVDLNKEAYYDLYRLFC